MDASLATLKACKHLSLSTNNIEKIGSLAGLESLEILSLGKNQIKKLETGRRRGDSGGAVDIVQPHRAFD